MLEELQIRNFVLFDQVLVPFGPGLNVLTGETGAGKSILIGALGLLLGNRSENGVLREGEEEASVTGRFLVDPGLDPDFATWMQEQDLSRESEDGQIILRRIVRTTRRGACYIGGTSLTRQQLEDLTGFLVDMLGQHEHQSLFSTDQQRRLLDRYADLGEDLRRFAGLWARYNEVLKAWDTWTEAKNQRDTQLEKAQRILADYEKVHPQPGEVEELESEKRRLDQFDRLRDLLQSLDGLLWGADRGGGVLPSLKQARTAAQSLAEADPAWRPAQERLESAFYEMEDLAGTYHQSARDLNFDPDRLAQVESRLSALYGLEKRYGPGWNRVQAAYAQAQAIVDQFQDTEGTEEALKTQLKTVEAEVAEAAAQLGRRRREAAKGLEGAAKACLADLGLGRAQLTIKVETRRAESGRALMGPSGCDAVDFFFSANPGQPPRPLREVASGGELSRMMLALKTVLTQADNIPILVFDEVDAGLGGEMGVALGRYLQNLASKKQVLCITHLASVAAFADHHLVLEKQVHENRTTTRVRRLSEEEKVSELARMLSGQTNPTSLGHARELRQAHQRRKEG